MFYLLTDQMNSAEVVGGQWLNKQFQICGQLRQQYTYLSFNSLIYHTANYSW